MDCLTLKLFLTSDDPIDILAGSTGTYYLGQLLLGAHGPGDRLTVVAKGGPDSLNGSFPDPPFSETSVDVVITPEPSSWTLLMIGVIAGGFATYVRQTVVRNASACS